MSRSADRVIHERRDQCTHYINMACLRREYTAIDDVSYQFLYHGVRATGATSAKNGIRAGKPPYLLNPVFLRDSSSVMTTHM